jgi:hypothetical protein
MTGPDPVLQAWHAAVADLGTRLVDLESDPTVEMARTGCLIGGSAVAWAAADAGLALAWETYRSVQALLEEIDAAPRRGRALLTATNLRGPDGPVDARTAMSSAIEAVDTALDVVRRISASWNELAGRAAAAAAQAAVARDHATERAAGALVDLLGTDPLAIAEADVTAVESLATRASARRSAAQTATARVELDLAHARTMLAELTTDVDVVARDLEYAGSRFQGIDALATWLERIEATAVGDPAHAAAGLDDWVAAAQVRRKELEAAAAPAKECMRRREEGRGLWNALRAKAAARHLDERSDVSAALTAAQDELWSAPCDLAAAEAALAAVAALLDPRGAR